MPCLKKIAGNNNSPIPGQTIYQNDALIGAAIDILIVNNVFENDLDTPNQPAEFNFLSETGALTRINPWQLGDKLIIVYSKRCGC